MKMGSKARHDVLPNNQLLLLGDSSGLNSIEALYLFTETLQCRLGFYFSIVTMSFQLALFYNVLIFIMYMSTGIWVCMLFVDTWLRNKLNKGCFVKIA